MANNIELQDRIGRQDIVDKICTLVDNLQKDQHFCLALNGDWGSGKTFVMQMIDKKLSLHKEYIIIKYDAWANNFYSDPLISILSCVIDGMQEMLSQIEGATEGLKEAGKSFVDFALEDNGKIGTIARGIKGIVGIVKKFNEPFSKDTDSKNIGEFRSYQSLLNEVKEKLNLITAYPDYEDKQTKLIILVDEIDRCLPDEQLKVLERLHHLFDVNNCAVICAINKESIANNVKITYGVDGKEYLRKFFDFNYDLTMKSDLLLNNLLTIDLVNYLKKECHIGDSFVLGANKYIDKDVFELLFSIINSRIEELKKTPDNRQISAFYDHIVELIKEYEFKNINTYSIFFIVIGMFIKKFIDCKFLEVSDNSKKYYLMKYMNIPARYDDYRERYYYNDYNDFYARFDAISNGLEKKGNYEADINGEPVIAESAKLKSLILMYGGNNDTE